MVYVMSDIHGCFNTMLECLKKVNFDETNDTLYILGDIMDRGPYMFELYEWIKERHGKNVFMIQGNHENMFIVDVLGMEGKNLLEKHKNEYSLLETSYIKIYLESFSINNYDYYDSIKYLSRNRKWEQLLEMANFFYELPYYYEVSLNKKNYTLVHAYCKKDISKTSVSDFIWNRDFAETNEFCTGKNVIYGHTPTIFDGKNGEIEIKENKKNNQISKKINIDCGCVYGNKLCILRLDDMKYWYNENID